MWQAIQRLIKERREGFEVGLKEVERYMKRRRVEGVEGVVKRLSNAQNGGAGSPDRNDPESAVSKSPISLDTDVVVTLRAVNLGVFPSTFSDHQVFKMEALNAQARFAASVGEGRIHSDIGVDAWAVEDRVGGCTERLPQRRSLSSRLRMSLLALLGHEEAPSSRFRKSRR